MELMASGSPIQQSSSLVPAAPWWTVDVSHFDNLGNDWESRSSYSIKVFLDDDFRQNRS